MPDDFGIIKRHKVIFFGHVYHPFPGEREESAARYQFTHQRGDGTISEGYIPVGFISTLPVESGDLVFLFIREGKSGPEFQIAWQTERNVLGEWHSNVDQIWGNTLSYLEKKDLVSEIDLEYMDADPFQLFGIDDPVTQKALRKLDRLPVLLCRGVKAELEDWFAYLLADPVADAKHKWVVEAFAEAELPVPWISYKGIGSIVCFTNKKSNITSWQHPMYNYFSQLLEFCRNSATKEEVLKMRIHRLLWKYEMTHQDTGGSDPDPLISPLYLELLAGIFGVDLVEEGYLVRVLKHYLKIFAHNYRQLEDIDIQEVEKCSDTVDLEREKFAVGVRLFNCHLREFRKILRAGWRDVLAYESPDIALDLDNLVNGKIECIECRVPALSYCLDCKDYYCLRCYRVIHSRGRRDKHVPFQLLVCSKCVRMPAKLKCRVTSKTFCHECYAMIHATKELPFETRETRPEKINYQAQKERMISAVAISMNEPERKNKKKEAELAVEDPLDKDDDQSEISGGSEGSRKEKSEGSDASWSSSAISSDWHPFYDSKGTRYFYSFSTRERMRRSPVNPARDTVSMTATDKTAASGFAELKAAEEEKKAEMAAAARAAESKLLEAKGITGSMHLTAGVAGVSALEPREIRAPYRDLHEEAGIADRMGTKEGV